MHKDAEAISIGLERYRAKYKILEGLSRLMLDPDWVHVRTVLSDLKSKSNESVLLNLRANNQEPAMSEINMVMAVERLENVFNNTAASVESLRKAIETEEKKFEALMTQSVEK